MEEYHNKLLTLEHSILLKPKMSAVKACRSPSSVFAGQGLILNLLVHVMSGDLILHKRTLEPVKTLVYGLKRYDLDRAAALIDVDQIDPLTGKPPKPQGFMSRKANVYLADVLDHMDAVLTSLDMFDEIAENLIDFTFNVRTVLYTGDLGSADGMNTDGLCRHEQYHAAPHAHYYHLPASHAAHRVLRDELCSCVVHTT